VPFLPPSGSWLKSYSSWYGSLRAETRPDGHKAQNSYQRHPVNTSKLSNKHVVAPSCTCSQLWAMLLHSSGGQPPLPPMTSSVVGIPWLLLLPMLQLLAGASVYAQTGMVFRHASNKQPQLLR
jgi:hypothetical protein